ncbi:hypothetical protein L6654_42740 [Bradyrhizobium sp. WYCCWR 13023]|uniref:Uncharacterized protein n=1 Tax=Bradyrhizobium zhengyangense TaxID=2911009 RepID=A0A9X1RF40_9BRAD|nr:hypothetical protein [Bradyrhizobium zhengyangense]MCG2633232.1 hypothetical protein [Bradyrhizobium zhengyangense]
MPIVFTILTIWVLLNILFVLLVIRPRKPQPTSRAKTLSPAIIERSQREDQDEPILLRHVIVSVAMGAFFALAPPLIALSDSIIRFFRKPPPN